MHSTRYILGTALPTASSTSVPNPFCTPVPSSLKYISTVLLNSKLPYEPQNGVQRPQNRVYSVPIVQLNFFLIMGIETISTQLHPHALPPSYLVAVPWRQKHHSRCILRLNRFAVNMP